MFPVVKAPDHQEESGCPISVVKLPYILDSQKAPFLLLIISATFMEYLPWAKNSESHQGYTDKEALTLSIFKGLKFWERDYSE